MGVHVFMFFLWVSMFLMFLCFYSASDVSKEAGYQAEIVDSYLQVVGELISGLYEVSQQANPSVKEGW